MKRVIYACWICRPCEVEGRDFEPVVCWNCGGKVVITARVTVKEKDDG
jgi:DNA-directed RNA polymerase subunit RPC12/RpoP